MASDAGEKLVLLSFENPAPCKNASRDERDHNLRAIHKYVVEGALLEAAAVSDMIENPEALSSQIEALEGWVDAAAAGEDELWAERGAAGRLDFMKTVLGWAAELGYGSADFLPDRTAGNGSAGLPACTSGNFSLQEGGAYTPYQ